MFRIIYVLLIALTIFSADAAYINCTRKNEEYSCGSACQTTCSNLGKPCDIMNIKCNDACYCKEGYARSNNDTSPCIPISKCP